ncbi:MAG: cyclic nucleotide-binding domain-containing protein [Cyanobacteria bacterium]|jgi:CRP/FNR family transcriptional regulator|nr:cyclic nucleotide-binding domain-containing protein [Cyanobacteria bacterium GSL.Bin21]
MVELEEVRSFLGQVRIFHGLPPEQLTALAKIAVLQSYQAGETIFWQGDPPKGFFLVRSGKVKVFKMSPTGKEQILQFFESGANFAEVPAFDGEPFPASATAMENSELVLFPRSRFLELLYSEPTLAVNLLAIFARHLRHFTWLIEDLSLREVPGRLASYLLQLSQQQENLDQVVLEVTKTQLAALLGTIPETLSRGFHKLAKEGLITIKGNMIQLRDRAGLAEKAGTVDH